VQGPIGFAHRFINMSAQVVMLADGSQASTCRPAMGYAFAAGTTDGCGAFNFHQATNETTLFWSFVGDLLSEPTEAEKACHAPKPILLNIGDIKRPYQWDAEVSARARVSPLFYVVVYFKNMTVEPSGLGPPSQVVPVQLLRIGLLFIAAVPAEFTTMAGRRLRSAIKAKLQSSGLVSEEDLPNVRVAISGLTNSYADYVTT
jgi:neutral ceramidase